MKKKIQRILLLVILQLGCFQGIPMRPVETEDLFARVRSAQIVHIMRAEDKDPDPGGSGED